MLNEPIPYQPIPGYSFLAFSLLVQEISETRDSNDKILIFERYISKIENDNDLMLAVRFISEGAFPKCSEQSTRIGPRTIGLLAASFCNIDYNLVIKPSKKATGSTSETIQLLMENIPEARQGRNPEPLRLTELEQIYTQLAKTHSRKDKQNILSESWKRMTGVEIKYFLRVMSRGSLGISFDIQSIIQALAHNFEFDPDQIRNTYLITGDLGMTAVLAKNDELDKATFNIYRPISFMLASPSYESVDALNNYIVEEIFDGLRCQVHAGKSGIRLFSRDHNDISQRFPEVVAFFNRKEFFDTVLDGVLCVYFDEKIQPYQLLHKRIRLKKPAQKVLDTYPVVFIGFDILYHRNETTLHLPLMERRLLLEKISRNNEILVSNQFEVTDQFQLRKLFQRALDHGNQGLILKYKNSMYEFGQRSKSWIKMKQADSSLNTVIMYAHAGSSKCNSFYSDFTLGIRVDDDERYEEEFIPIGKASCCYSNNEMKLLHDKITDLIFDRYGPTLALRPEIVVEIEFDEIQLNRRTKANFTLRLPRFRSIRWDLEKKDSHTLNDVEHLYQKKMNAPRIKQVENPSFIITKSFL
jgi:DNA ligase-1